MKKLTTAEAPGYNSANPEIMKEPLVGDSPNGVINGGAANGGAGNGAAVNGNGDRDFWISRIGATIREQRVGRFTVEELAERAGVSAGLISQIERGIGNPSFATLLRLASSLDLPLATMFNDPSEGRHNMLVRRADRRRIEIPSQGVVMELIVPDTERKLGVVSMTIPAHFDGANSSDSHEGEECVIVQSGSLVATVGGQEFHLEAGDSLTYDASLPHWWHNRTDSAAVMLAVSTPPSLGRAH